MVAGMFWSVLFIAACLSFPDRQEQAFHTDPGCRELISDLIDRGSAVNDSSE